MKHFNLTLLMTVLCLGVGHSQSKKELSATMDTLNLRLDSLKGAIDSLSGTVVLKDSASLQRDTFLRTQVEALQGAQVKIQEEVAAVKEALKAIPILQEEVIKLKASDSVRTAKEEANAAELAKRLQEFSKKYADYKYQVDDYSFRFTPSFGWSLGVQWSRSKEVPEYKVDSTGLMNPLDLARFGVWLDQVANESFKYGFFEVEASDWAVGETTDWYFTSGAGLGGSYKSGFDGWYSEFGTGLGMLLAYCDLKKDKCYETEDRSGLDGTSLIGLTTQIRLGWNFIPGHYFPEVRNNKYLSSLGVSTGVLWRGVWGVAGFVDGEFTPPTDLTDAFFEENSAFILGNVYAWEFTLTAQF